MGALKLYLDLINLFLFLLHTIGLGRARQLRHRKGLFLKIPCITMSSMPCSLERLTSALPHLRQCVSLVVIALLNSTQKLEPEEIDSSYYVKIAEIL